MMLDVSVKNRLSQIPREVSNPKISKLLKKKKTKRSRNKKNISPKIHTKFTPSSLTTTTTKNSTPLSSSTTFTPSSLIPNTLSSATQFTSSSLIPNSHSSTAFTSSSLTTKHTHHLSPATTFTPLTKNTLPPPIHHYNNRKTNSLLASAMVPKRQYFKPTTQILSPKEDTFFLTKKLPPFAEKKHPSSLSSSSSKNNNVKIELNNDNTLTGSIPITHVSLPPVIIISPKENNTSSGGVVVNNINKKFNQSIALGKRNFYENEENTQPRKRRKIAASSSSSSPPLMKLTTRLKIEDHHNNNNNNETKNFRPTRKRRHKNNNNSLSNNNNSQAQKSLLKKEKNENNNEMITTTGGGVITRSISRKNSKQQKSKLNEKEQRKYKVKKEKNTFVEPVAQMDKCLSLLPFESCENANVVIYPPTNYVARRQENHHARNVDINLDETFHSLPPRVSLNPTELFERQVAENVEPCARYVSHNGFPMNPHSSGRHPQHVPKGPLLQKLMLNSLEEIDDKRRAGNHREALIEMGAFFQSIYSHIIDKQCAQYVPQFIPKLWYIAQLAHRQWSNGNLNFSPVQMYHNDFFDDGNISGFDSRSTTSSPNNFLAPDLSHSIKDAFPSDSLVYQYPPMLDETHKTVKNIKRENILTMPLEKLCVKDWFNRCTSYHRCEKKPLNINKRGVVLMQMANEVSQLRRVENLTLASLTYPREINEFTSVLSPMNLEFPQKARPEETIVVEKKGSDERLAIFTHRVATSTYKKVTECYQNRHKLMFEYKNENVFQVCWGDICLKFIPGGEELRFKAGIVGQTKKYPNRIFHAIIAEEAMKLEIFYKNTAREVFNVTLKNANGMQRFEISTKVRDGFIGLGGR